MSGYYMLERRLTVYTDLELMQSLIETRSGGGTGIRRITAFNRDKVEKGMNQGCGQVSSLKRRLER